jgi:hypothetical protein
MTATGNCSRLVCIRPDRTVLPHDNIVETWIVGALVLPHLVVYALQDISLGDYIQITVFRTLATHSNVPQILVDESVSELGNPPLAVQHFCQPSGVSINQNVLPYRHSHVTLLIWNAPDTPLSVYRPLTPHSLGINVLSSLLRSHNFLIAQVCDDVVKQDAHLDLLLNSFSQVSQRVVILNLAQVRPAR